LTPQNTERLIALDYTEVLGVLSFLPAISERAAPTAAERCAGGAFSAAVNGAWRNWPRWYEAKLRGWIEYYGSCGKWRLSKILTALNNRLVRWAQRKYKRFRRYDETVS